MEQFLPRGFVIFCDDVRHEEGGKPSFMGVYTQSMFVGATFPAAVPKFFAFVSYVDSLSEPHGDVTIQLFLPGDPDDKPSATAELPILKMVEASPKKTPAGNDATKLSVQIELQMIPLVIKQEGIIRVIAIFDGGSIELGKLEIASRPPAQEAQVPNSSQAEAEAQSS
jgi:hypothetical protein